MIPRTMKTKMNTDTIISATVKARVRRARRARRAPAGAGLGGGRKFLTQGRKKTPRGSGGRGARGARRRALAWGRKESSSVRREIVRDGVGEIDSLVFPAERPRRIHLDEIDAVPRAGGQHGDGGVVGSVNGICAGHGKIQQR